MKFDKPAIGPGELKTSLLPKLRRDQCSRGATKANKVKWAKPIVVKPLNWGTK